MGHIMSLSHDEFLCLDFIVHFKNGTSQEPAQPVQQQQRKKKKMS